MHTDDRRTVSGCFLFADHGLTEAAEAILDRCPHPELPERRTDLLPGLL